MVSHNYSCFSTLIPQEKVEEDKYMRQKDAAILEKIHAKMMEDAMAAAEASADSQFDDHVKPVMEEIRAMMASGDSLSDESLEALARWKLGL